MSRISAFVIAGTHSGCGKTTVSLGIMSALKIRGLVVQPFKVGPDFIDPGHHRAVTGRNSHNLDGWMLDRKYNKELFLRNLMGADVGVVEGVMGLFDGHSGTGESGSSAQMAKWLDLPVVLVIDAGSMARSAAAIAYGFSRFDPELPVKGVIFNRVGSKAHADILKEAMSCLPDIRIFGYLPREKGLEIPSRHLGLVTSEDFKLDQRVIKRLAEWIEVNADIDYMLESLKIYENRLPSNPIESSGLNRHGRVRISPATPLHENTGCAFSDSRGGIFTVKRATGQTDPKTRIAVAMDEAFSFYYPENLRLLEEAGAEIVVFSPLRSRGLPEGIKGIILGGGYPELYSQRISKNISLLNEIKGFALSGAPVYAECGGFMILMKEIHDLEGRIFPMAGIFPVAARMEDRIKALGYREIITQKEGLLGPAGTRLRGHEFHYSGIIEDKISMDMIYSVKTRRTSEGYAEGYLRKGVLGSYIHLHFGSNPDTARHIVKYCQRAG